jgi:hemerythrin
MSTVQEIERAIEKLSREEVLVLTNWLSTHFSDLWDRQIQEDISNGLLDDLADEALAEHRAGKSLPLPSDEE